MTTSHPTLGGPAIALPAELHDWLTAHAADLDQHNTASDQVLGRLAAADLFRIGVDECDGGVGGSTGDAVLAIAAVSERSLTAGFMFWGQRAFIEYLLQSPNQALREKWLPTLLTGQRAGATGLSNAMKFLSGIESLQVRAQHTAQAWTLTGSLAWATNLKPERFVVAAAVDRDDGPPFIAALAAGRPGLVRSDDLDLIALRGSHTASVAIDAMPITTDDVIHSNAREFLPRVRPAFLGLQCGLSIGLAKASLDAAESLGGSARPVLLEPIGQTRDALARITGQLLTGVADGRFVAGAAELFRLRIELAGVVQQSVQLELQASGGRAYHRDQPLAFARRWREAAFIPIVTPSLTQLQGELIKQSRATAAEPVARDVPPAVARD